MCTNRVAFHREPLSEETFTQSHFWEIVADTFPGANREDTVAIVKRCY